MNTHSSTPLASADALEARLREIGAARYHDKHPFHKLLHGGKLSRGQIQAWALNRYYYQCSIPIKDAFVVAKFRDREVRREWLHRITDHDGTAQSDLGILTAAERSLLEEAIAYDGLQRCLENGLCCFAEYCVTSPSGYELPFQGDIEDDGSCLFLRTPYDIRDGDSINIENCVTEDW